MTVRREVQRVTMRRFKVRSDGGGGCAVGADAGERGCGLCPGHASREVDLGRRCWGATGWRVVRGVMCDVCVE